MSKLLLTDIDGVVLDWLGSFKHYLTDRGIEQNDQTLDGLIEQHVETFQQSSYYFGCLKTCKKSEMYLKKIHDLNYKIVAITACGTSDVIKSFRQNNLYQHFGDLFDDILFVNVHDSKQPLLQSFDSAVWVEDNYTHYVSGVFCGHNSFLIQHPYNAHHSANFVQDWQDIYEKIK
jgi:FMN phosphatase YigB (HAD superfamily)